MTTPLIFTDPLSMKAGLEERPFIHFVLSQGNRLGMVGTNSSGSEVRGQTALWRRKQTSPLRGALGAMRGPTGGACTGISGWDAPGCEGQAWPILKCGAEVRDEESAVPETPSSSGTYQLWNT